MVDSAIDIALIVPWWDHPELVVVWERNMVFLAGARLVIVDNGSAPATAHALAEFAHRHQNVLLLRHENNLGFAAANNSGAHIARAKHLLFVNNDVEFQAALPLTAWAQLAADGLAGPAPVFENELGVPYVEGWALCIKTSVLAEMGGWAEDFGPGYWDDVDLCLRTAIAGRQVATIPEVGRYIRHFGSLTGNDGRLDKRELHIRNLEQFALRATASLNLLPVEALAQFVRSIKGVTRIPGIAQHYSDHGRPSTAAAIGGLVDAVKRASTANQQVSPETPNLEFTQGAHPISTKWPEQVPIRLFGQFSSATGLGVSARQTAKAMIAAGVPLRLVNLDPYYPTGDVSEEMSGLEGHFVDATVSTSLPVNIYCMPVADFLGIEQRIPIALRQARLHAGIVWWETTTFHPRWLESLTRLDVVVGFSEFVSGVAANSLSLTHVLAGQQPLFLPPDIHPNRTRFGLPEDATVFLASFDPTSDPLRKNPLGVIQAFRFAFAAGEPDVRLILRLNNANSTNIGRETLSLLIDAATQDRRIGFVIDPMRYSDVLSLYASADVHVSLHRAEGLGLGMLESMRLGIPVIATGWSGNMSFMDNRCACLVRYRLVPAQGNHPVYRPEILGTGAVWADPVLEDAAAWMRHLYTRPSERQRIGEEARLKATTYQENALHLEWLREIGKIDASSTVLPAVSGKYSSGRVLG